MNNALAGRGIVITRPAHQAEPLADLIRAAGGRAILFPVLQIEDVADLQPLYAQIDRLDAFDIGIFISPNAVNKAINLIRARRTLPASLTLAAIGRGSARELKRLGISGVIAPESRWDSEALLDLPEFADIAGKRVMIFRGDGGREVLGHTLGERGAHIEYAECYRRSRPDTSAAQLLRQWSRNEIDAVTVMSGDSLHNLYDMIGKLGREWLKDTPVFVPHERIAETGRAQGLKNLQVTAGGDDGLVEGLVAWFAASGA
jgi:uroporphyrinogen-III synthase